jgi:hypothetical protein
MMTENEIKQNSKESFETLGYILELSLGDLIEEIKFSNIDFEVSTSDGLLDANGELNIKIGISNPDITTIAGKLRSVDSRLNEVFRTYCLTHDGKLTKNKDLGESMSIGHIVYSMNYNSAEENILLLIGFILFDL